MFTSFTCQSVSLQSAFVAHRVPAMIACHVQSAQRFHMKSRLRFKFPTPWKTLIIKLPPPWDNKGVKCPGYARGGGMLKLRFDRYIIQLWWQFFQMFVYGDVGYAQTWQVFTLKNCIEPFS